MKNIYLFVYGTLKRGFHNHYLLDEADFICEATTKQKYPMVNTEEGYPYLIDDEGFGHNVEGEVYKISAKILLILEILEGYPDHYIHKKIQVVSNGVELFALVFFFNDTLDYANLELLKSFE